MQILLADSHKKVELNEAEVESSAINVDAIHGKVLAYNVELIEKAVNIFQQTLTQIK